MEPIDLSDLSDDQLVALAAACCGEAVRRGFGTEQAVRAEMLSALERRQIAEQFATLEARRLRQVEAARVATEAADARRLAEVQATAAAAAERERARLAVQIAFAESWTALLGGGWTVTVWQSRDDARDRRVYGDREDGGRVEYRNGKLRATQAGVRPGLRPPLTALCAQALGTWPRVRLDCDALVVAKETA